MNIRARFGHHPSSKPKPKKTNTKLNEKKLNQTFEVNKSKIKEKK
jgi:hypothetical protein